MKKLLSLLTLILIAFSAKSQEFIDTIYTLSDDTIVCKITLVNNYNIFYQYNPKKRNVEFSDIPRSQVANFTINSKDVTVQKQEDDSHLLEPNLGFSENDGVIYASNVETPPKFPGGINGLYKYLEDNVRVYSRDNEVFGDVTALVLYELLIMSDGKIKAAGIAESSILNCGFDVKADYLEKEILKQICLASDWEPGIIDGEKVNMNIYLPLKFKVDSNRILIFPSKYLFIFKNRRK